MSTKLTVEVVSQLFKVLTSYLDSKCESIPYRVTSFAVSPGSSQNDNYLSSIYSVEFRIGREEKETESFHFIFKSQIIGTKHEDGSEYFWNIIFVKEQLAYKLIEERMRGLTVGSKLFTPQLHYFYTEGEQYSCLILDNLASNGFYIPATRQSGLSLREAKIMVKTLANLHAASLVLEAEDGEPLGKKYEFCGAEMMFSEGVKSIIGTFIQNTFLGVLEAAQILRPDLAQLLKNLNEKKNVFDRLCDWVKADHAQSTFPCFCHGDPRTANMFTKMDSESDEADELKLIDFQLVRYASPMTDLHYAIQLGTTKQFRTEHLNTILHEYHTEFRTFLSRHPNVKLLNPNVELWTFEKLLDDYNNFNIYGLLVALVLLPVTFYSRNSENKNVDQMNSMERENFVRNERKSFVAKIVMTDDELANRIFDICDEMKVKNVF